jgi:hypothetical protein
MGTSHTARGRTEFSGETPRDVVLRGLNDPAISETPTLYQARRIVRLHAVAFETALTLAHLAYSAGLPR